MPIWVGSSAARTRWQRMQFLSLTPHEAVLDATRVREKHPSANGRRHSLCISRIRHCRPQMLLRVRERSVYASVSEGLAAYVRWSVDFTESFNWQLEFSLSVALLD